jgi:hypothetical protein
MDHSKGVWSGLCLRRASPSETTDASGRAGPSMGGPELHLPRMRENRAITRKRRLQPHAVSTRFGSKPRPVSIGQKV